MKLLKNFIKLSRYKEHLPFVVPLTILGALIAINNTPLTLDFRLVTTLIANILAVSFAFMINEIEDAEDDKRDPKRALKNPIASKAIDKQTAYLGTFAVAGIAILLYFFSGKAVLFIGLLTILLAQLYSWKKVRLKAWPITDFVSHSLMLSALLIIAGYVTYSTQNNIIISLIAFSMTLFSVYGQLYNQLRDFDMDKKAGLKNTAILLGEDRTKILMYMTLTLGLSFLLVAIYKDAFPTWLIIPLIASVAVSMNFSTKTDLRGNALVDVSGGTHQQALIIANAIVFSWLLRILLLNL
jgi:4-hydroxybenzoate polyprenyltransferase